MICSISAISQTFLFCCTKAKAIRYLNHWNSEWFVNKKSDICRRNVPLQWLCVLSIKTTTYVYNRFNTSFCARDRKTNQSISNLNRKFWNKSTQQLKPTTALIDLCFNKKFEQEKKSLYKSIFKPIYVNTYYV